MVQRNLVNKVASDNWNLCSGKSELFSTSEVPAIYLFIMLSYAHIYVILLVLCLPLQDSASGQSYRNKQASERSSYGTRNRYLYHNRRYPTSAAQKRKTKGKKSDPFKNNMYFSVATIGIPYILYWMLCIFLKSKQETNIFRWYPYKLTILKRNHCCLLLTGSWIKPSQNQFVIIKLKGNTELHCSSYHHMLSPIHSANQFVNIEQKIFCTDKVSPSLQLLNFLVVHCHFKSWLKVCFLDK